jgi:putative intracellular protease/amidase
MYKQKFQPDGMIIDWNKQPGVKGKYHAVIIIGGKGARKSLWDDPIVPQILTDHYRFGSIVGAIGTSLVVLVRSSLVTGEVPMPEDDITCQELEKLNVVCAEVPVTCVGNVVLGRGENSVHEFSQTIINLLGNQ